MNKVILYNWKRKWQKVYFDPEDGKVTVIWFKRPADKGTGWAFRHKRKWYALRREKTELVFQTGKNKWFLNEVNMFSITKQPGKNNCIFRIFENKTMRLEVYFSSPERSIWNRLDPTFDHFDKEQQDFFSRVSQLSQDQKWQSDFIKQL
ncbi:MAG: hypothetical protein CSA81_04730 [Acidobacteria bacterium]|nr:MAG: hypothetical protein CSA81_04730 [Acidobacteriota bacterium]